MDPLGMAAGIFHALQCFMHMFSKLKSDVRFHLRLLQEQKSTAAYFVRDRAQAVPVVEGNRDERPAKCAHGSPSQEGGAHGLLQIDGEVVWPVKLHCYLQPIL